MNYNFTDDVRRALALAREEALDLRHDYVGTEHMLLALVRHGETPAGAILERHGVSAVQVKKRVAESVRKGKRTIAIGELPYTSRGKKVLEFAMASARRLSDSYVGTEHLLLGLLAEEKGIGAQVLNSLGVSERSAMEVLKSVRRGEADGGVTEPVFFVEVDADSATPMYEQIMARIEEAVATGRLRPGERLPAVRDLASELGVAPGTVARAYTVLEGKGVLETEGARGTRVAVRGSAQSPSGERVEALEGLLRPVVVAGFHMGADAAQLRAALERAMSGIFPAGGGQVGP